VLLQAGDTSVHPSERSKVSINMLGFSAMKKSEYGGAWSEISVQRCAAEFVGTVFLMFTVASNRHTESVCAAIGAGSALAAMIYALGPVSGGHFNPAITLAVLASGRRKISSADALSYVLSQVVGAIVGAALCWASLPQLNHSKPHVIGFPGYSDGAAATAETLYTAALAYVLLSVLTTEKADGNCPNAFFGVAAGFTLTAATIAIGPYSGCDLNPAISMGGALIAHFSDGSATLRHFALHVLATSIGALAGAGAFFVAWGGAFQRDEYASEDGERPSTAMVFKPPTDLLRAFELPRDVATHTLNCSLTWETVPANPMKKDLPKIVDVDLACVKFGRSGDCQGAVYFQQKEDSGIKHSGDEVMPSTHPGAQKKASDSEAITLKLCNVSSSVQALVFVAIIYSAGQSFKDVAKYSLRLVDMTAGKKEYCKFDEKKKENCNALVSAVLFRSDGNDPSLWSFKVVDEAHSVPTNSSYRKIIPQLQQLLQREYITGSNA
jgi:aquaporin Z